jgi:UPF0755 protein
VDSDARLSDDDGPLWPVPGPPPPRRGRHRRRRATALLLIAGAAAVAILVVVLALGRRHGPPPPPPTLHITFAEGLTRAEMAKQITTVDGIARRTRNLDPIMTERGYLAATRSILTPAWFETPRRRRALEGFLFPSTYEFLEATPARTLAAQQLTAFHDAWAALDLNYARSKNLTPYDVLTIASMIEKEIAAPEERRLAAAVIYNRLKAHMTLGIDATLRYGLRIPASASITRADLASNNPYNTRKLHGLPPTPIANPGLAALEAAAHPAQVGYLFYVRKPDGVHHFFTASYDAFKRYCAAHGYGPC